jgi:hypothetical protein
MRRLKSFFSLVLFAIFSSQLIANPSTSILKWTPSTSKDNVAVEVQWFKANDFISANKDEGVGKLRSFSSVMDTFCGDDPNLRQKFSEWVSNEYQMKDFYYHPAAQKPDDIGAVISAYHTPYECDQAKFINWAKKEQNLNDFLLPSARKMNPWKGNLISPIVESKADIDEMTLMKTNGYVACFADQKAYFLGDNRYNPYRWLTPINEIHHKEQPSWALRVSAKPEHWEDSVSILSKAKTKLEEKRIMLNYKFSLEITDHREDMNEYHVDDYLAKAEGNGIVNQTYQNAIKYAWNGQSADGKQLEPLQKKMINKFMRTRFEPVNFQVGVGINFNERDERYRLAEFMICTYNQKPSNVYPNSPGHIGFEPTANDTLNPTITDGGNNGAGSWWRAPVDVLDHHELTKGDTSSWLSDNDYLELKEPKLRKRTFTGSIDITKFYHQALKSKFFPGQRGYWVNRWVGFEGDHPPFKNPAEEHGIEWAFLIAESHGPLRFEMEVEEFDVTFETKKTKTSTH